MCWHYSEAHHRHHHLRPHANRLSIGQPKRDPHGTNNHFGVEHAKTLHRYRSRESERCGERIESCVSDLYHLLCADCLLGAAGTKQASITITVSKRKGGR